MDFTRAMKGSLIGFDRQGNTILFPLFVQCDSCGGSGMIKDGQPCPDKCIEGKVPYDHNVEVLVKLVEQSDQLQEAIYSVVDKKFAENYEEHRAKLEAAEDAEDL